MLENFARNPEQSGNILQAIVTLLKHPNPNKGPDHDTGASGYSRPKPPPSTPFSEGRAPDPDSE
jgi:hypothetical protein